MRKPELGGHWLDQPFAEDPIVALKHALAWLKHLHRMADKARESGGSVAVQQAITRQKELIYCLNEKAREKRGAHV
jgi:hypothetical protein